METQGKSPFFRWREHYRIGDAGLDREHEELCAGLNKLHDAIGPGKSRAAAGAALDHFIEAIKKHFRAEERLMRDLGYAKLEGHAADHRSFARKLDAFRDQFHDHLAELDEAMLREFKDWFRDHFLLVDKPLGAFLERKRLS